MKSILLLTTLFSATVGLAQHEHPQTQTADTLKKSVPREVHAQIGDTHMSIHYYSPAVRGRMIWGGLVPMGEPWVTGAHSATTWEFNNDITINGRNVPSGKYAIFTIPNKDSWIIIINRNWEQHLTDEYNVKDDVIRTEVKPTQVPHQERLSYAVTSNGKKGELIISWEKVKVILPFGVTK